MSGPAARAHLPWWLFPPSPLAAALLSLIGTTAPAMRPDLGIGYGAVAALYVAQTGGSVAGALGVGLSDRRLLRPAAMTTIAALALISATVVGLAGVIVAMAVGGFAIYGNNARAQFELSAVAGVGRSRALSLFHVCGGAGGLLAPLCIAGLLHAGVSWRAGFLLVAGSLLVYAPWGRRWGTTPTPRMSLRVTRLTRPARWALVVASISLGIQNVVGLWLATLLHDDFAVSPAAASGGIAVYMAALLTARVAVASLLHRVDEGRVLALGSVVVTLGLVLLGAAPTAITVVCAAAAIAAGAGPMLALGIARAADLSGDDRMSASAAMAGGGIAMIAFPAAIVALQLVVGLQLAVAALAVPALVVVAGVWRSSAGAPLAAAPEAVG